MLLIDASQINTGGGKVLLEYLIDLLRIQKYEFYLIIDSRCDLKRNDFPAFRMKSLLKERKKVYREILKNYPIKQVLCFSSIPPPFRIHGTITYTYFHAPNLLHNAVLTNFSLKYKLLRKFKLVYNKYYFRFSDYIFVQTEHMVDAIQKTYGINESKFIYAPFFDVGQMVNVIERNKNEAKKYDFSYISLPAPHKNHLNLLKAWEILFERGVWPTLVVTAVQTKHQVQVLDIVNRLIDKGVNIINIGKVPFEEAIRYTSESRFTIYPSINETLGLGYVEAYYAGQKVLASDLQITYDVIKPSLTFDPFSPEDIADKVEYALNNELPPTELKLKNEVDKLIKLLTNNE